MQSIGVDGVLIISWRRKNSSHDATAHHTSAGNLRVRPGISYYLRVPWMNRLSSAPPRARADRRIAGVGPVGSKVDARLLLREAPLTDFDWKAIAASQGRAWIGEISGGPYRLELRIPGAAVAVNDLLVGDLWVLAGQSNMEGYGDLVDVERETNWFTASTRPTAGWLPKSRCTDWLTPPTACTGDAMPRSSPRSGRATVCSSSL
jgi:hypothetical protein